MASWLKPGSIRGELALFVVALALPLVALIAYNLLETAQDELADADAFVRRLADNSANRATRFIEDAKATLEPLARRELVRAMDPARCDPGLNDILALYPRASNFLVVNRDGRILCGAIPPPRDRVVRIRDEALLREIVSSGRFALSQPVIGIINKRWTLAAVQPVFDATGGVAGTISMSIDLINWSPLAARSGLPPGTAVALVTAPGIVIATSEDAQSWIGRDIGAGEVMRQVRGRSAGVVRASGTVDGDRIWGFREVPGAGWYAVSSIPTALVYAPLREQLVRSALLLVLALGAALALALLFGRRLTRPIRDIAEAVRRRAEGHEEARVPESGPREIAAVARELNRSTESARRLAHEREELLARMLMERERMPIAFLLLDAADVITYANPAAERMFGLRADELVGRRPQECYVPAERHALVAQLFERLRRGEHVGSTGESVRKDGTRLHIEWVATPLYRADGGYDGHISMATDITERLRAEQRLQLAQRLYAALSEVNETIVRVRDREELFRQVCRICVERIGFVVAYVALVQAGRVVPQVYAGPGSGFLDDTTFSLDPADPLSSTVTAEAVRSKRAAVANEVDADPGKIAGRPLRERIGSKAAASFPLFLGDQVIGALTLHSAVADFFDPGLVELLQRMADDLSFALDKLAERETLAELRRELEERVRRRTAELEAANQELEAFSYSVSHDLRAPVRHVDGFVRLLDKELPQPSEKAAHYLATIASAARRMGALIDDLLQLSRTGRQALALRIVDLQPLVRELAAECAQEAGAREIEWTVGEMPAVMADAPLLRIVLQNLLSNAVKYTRARPVARIAVQVRTLDTGETALSVSDNGVGFDMRFQDKLFGVFQRLHRDEEFEGTGIGLATARRIVHRHGHRIWAESRPGEGATFSFTITRAEVVHEGIADTAGRG
jgi:PAS domain S-box-containing protein